MSPLHQILLHGATQMIFLDLTPSVRTGGIIQIGGSEPVEIWPLGFTRCPSSSVSFTKNRCGIQRATRTTSRRSQPVSSFREFCLRSRARTCNGSHLLLTNCSAAGIPRRALSAEEWSADARTCWAQAQGPSGIGPATQGPATDVC